MDIARSQCNVDARQLPASPGKTPKRTTGTLDTLLKMVKVARGSPGVRFETSTKWIEQHNESHLRVCLPGASEKHTEGGAATRNPLKTLRNTHIRRDNPAPRLRVGDPIQQAHRNKLRNIPARNPGNTRDLRPYFRSLSRRVRQLGTPIFVPILDFARTFEKTLAATFFLCRSLSGPFC